MKSRRFKPRWPIDSQYRASLVSPALHWVDRGASPRAAAVWLHSYLMLWDDLSPPTVATLYRWILAAHRGRKRSA